MSKRTSYIILFILVISILYFAEKLFHKFEQTRASSVPWESEFSSQFLPTSSSGIIIEHTFYTLSYVESHEQAEWVAYELKKNHLKGKDFERPYFELDPRVKSKSAHWRNYKNSGYDRGHLCPAGDRSFSYEAYLETFLTSNISPQNPEFNGGIWNSLEQKVRYWATIYDGLYVITGGVLKPGLKSIGKEKVSIPEEFYKILIDKEGEDYKVLAFLIPSTSTTQSIYDFVVPIDDIEKATGLDFLHELPDVLEDELEREVKVSDWARF